jgi:YqjK-like protein
VIAVNDFDLLIRQQRLLMRSAQLRASLSHDLQGLQTPLSLVDAAKASAHWLGKHPVYPSIALGALLLLKPRRALAWSRRLLGGWLTVRRLRQWL